MAMEERHAADNWIGKIHHQVHRAPIRDVYGIDPRRIVHWLLAHRIRQKMDLMNVKWMDLFSRIDNAPVLQRTYVNRQHRPGIHFKFLPVDIETILIFTEGNNEL